MTTKAEWPALSERCEKATGPDREIDARITLAHRPYLFAKPYIQLDIGKWIRTDGCPDVVTAPDYTASLDAITALIERHVLDVCSHGYEKTCDEQWKGCVGFVEIPRSDGETKFIYGHAITPALSLCSSFCRAMAEKAA